MKCKFAWGKRWLSLVLAACMLLGCVPFGALATEAPEEMTEASTEATEVPSETTEAPTEATEAPTETTEAPTEAAEVSGAETPAARSAAAPWDTDGDGVLEILAIGNSFSVDALEYGYQIAADLGIENIALGNLYIGGCSLATHIANANADKGAYTYYFNDSGSWTTTKSYKISTALADRSWDYVTMQQRSPDSGLESTYNEDLTNLIAYVKERSDAKLAWHMTWAYQSDSTHTGFANYGNDQMTMYNGIVTAAKNRILINGDISYVIPSGTAVQNSRTSLLGDTTTRDGYHMSKQYGRYLTGLMFLKTLTGLDISGISYAPAGVDAQQKAIAIESVNNAAMSPLAVTDSAYILQEPGEGYARLDLQLTKGAFWHPSVGTDLFFDESNSNQFFATAKFTREQLPVGSVILLESGWQYRPDGWVTDALQTGTRESETTQNYTIVTEDWWKNYTIRSFNLSKVGKPSLEAVDLEIAGEALRIFVPEPEEEEPISFPGKKVSILSHSASTYAGVSNDTKANSTIGKNDVYYTEGRHGVYLKDTWWQQAIDALGMELLVNNSWSGSCIFEPRKGAASVGYGDRAVNLHNDHTGEEPDIIWVYLGGNDFAYFKDTFGKAADVKMDELIQQQVDGTYLYATPKTACEAYAIMLHKVMTRYPEAKIYCMTQLAAREPDYVEDNRPHTGQPTAYMAELMIIAEAFRLPVIDIENCISREAEEFDQYIGDKRAHPNALGMDRITNAVLSVMLGTQAEIRHVTSEDKTVKEQAVLLGGSYSATVDLREGESAVVRMNGEDITAQAVRGNRITVSKVTGDMEITTSLRQTSLNFRWEMQDNALVSNGEADNPLTKITGTVTEGVLQNGHYQLDTPMILRHDYNWQLQWQCSGNWRGTMLASQTDLEPGVLYLTRTKGGQLCLGTMVGTKYHNYGVDLSTVTEGSHTFRLTNRVAEDGSNMVWVSLDGGEEVPMNRFFVGSVDQGRNDDWVSGKNFVFPSMGTKKYPLNDFDLAYLEVREGSHVHSWNGTACLTCGEVMETLSLAYDDHYDITGKTVEILDGGKPTSWQVGYGVEENAVPDAAVVELQDNYLVATGIGTARVNIDGIPHQITVTAAPISLLLLVGQSNMRGSEGNANQSIICPEGMVYATYGDDRGDDNTAMTVANARYFAPSALTGQYSTVNVEGTTDCLEGYPVYSLTEAGAGKIGPDSGYAYEWVKATGEKVWVVNAAHGGTSINLWQPGGKEYEECRALFTACQETLRKEIAAGHFTLNHMVYFWCQGCSDRTQSAQWYVNKYLAMHEGFKTELAFDHDSNAATPDRVFEFGGITPVRVGSTAACYRDGVSQYANPYSYHESFVDLRFSGPRVAQFWMGNNPELTDIHLTCTIGDDWVWMPDGTNGVSDYFQAHYPGGTVDYTPQVAQKASWYTPTTPNAVHDTIHYNQIGYNEVGREAVRNALIILGEKEAPTAETKVEFLSWDGITPVEEIKAWTTGCSDSLVVPIVSPIWKAKEVTYSVTEGLTYSYYDLLSADAQTAGTLTAGTGNTVRVVKQDPGAYFAEHLSVLPEKLCSGVNLWNVLEHDPEFYYSGTHWGKHSSRDVCSVTIPVRPGDKIYATAFGKAGENGHATSNGIRCTFFGEYAVVKTLDPAGTYAEFSKNGGYLVVPEGTVAMNIPMWSNADTNELYILNLPHDREEGICGICGKDSHVHSFGDWQTAVLPSAEGPGTEQRKCSCGETESRSVEGSWQKYALAAHMASLPERFCGGTNLWNLLEHDPMYFASGTNWSKYSGGNVCSVTIPVKPGDKIFATAFGKAGENGNASSNGIRTTFFGSFDVVKTMSPAETYAEFAANGGYLLAPEGAIAINVAMWSGGSENELYILNAAHDYQPATDTILECAICGAVVGGHRIDVPAGEVWIDGVKYAAREDENGKYVLLEGTGAGILTVYSYNDAAASDPHSQYPTGMQVWRLKFENGRYVSTYVPEFDNLLQYAGASIRVTGIKGIRMITGIDKALRQQLMDGSLGYTLVEYGTAVAWADDLKGTAPVLGDGKTMYNYAYKQGTADPIFADTGSTVQYTNVLVGFTDDQLAGDLVLRPYLILKDKEGQQFTIYGGCVQRSIGYIAKQNQTTFPEGTKADAYIEAIISKVYG